ncbi:2983_t:CDS:2 [Cetraspora pellucida]|uniref:2983_t:CDS:1 n=1 Tax=Cetraspora pellucida TaxID=1433469 RepID=A0ACA9KRR0_9GLOM|nr:2983_t:CDS:2 [Cetraspora pellucida]
MASKIFMGNMPELMERILNNLNKEIHSLHSCALVSRHWCEMSIPIIWRNPFSFQVFKPMFISTYISSYEDLDDDVKSILKKYGIIINFQQNSLFHYVRFLEVLSLSLLNYGVDHWISIHLHDEDQNIEKIKYHVANLLLKIFIKDGVTLSELGLDSLNNFIEINSEIFFALFDSDYLPQLCHELASIIKSQEHLEYFNFTCKLNTQSWELYGIILALKGQKDALKVITLDHCNYSSEFEVLRDCENLDVIRIFYCSNEIFNKFNSKISILEINTTGLYNASGLIQILEKSGSSLQRFKLNDENRYFNDEDDEDDEDSYSLFNFNRKGYLIRSQRLLLETLMTSCPNIVHLHILGVVKYSTHILKLISSLQKLKFLTIGWDDEFDESKPEEKEKMEVLVKQLAEILPPTLQYLNLSKKYLGLRINNLLEHCNAPLEKLLFWMPAHNEDETINAIIRFCVRKKTLNIVGVNGFKVDWEKIEKDLERYVKVVSYCSFAVSV